jgi:hypothetical protein
MRLSVRLHGRHPARKTLDTKLTVLETDTYRIAYLAVLSKGKLEKDDASAMLGAQIQKELSLEQIKDLILIMKKYPKQFGDFKELTDQAIENLKKSGFVPQRCL